MLIATLLASSSVVFPQAPGAVVTLNIPGRSNENVSAAADGRFVALAWSAAAQNATDIYAALSRDGGVTFSAPSRVNTTPGDARVGGEQPPRVALIPRRDGTPAVAVVWTAPGASGTKLLSARSTDGARTFSGATLVPGGEAAGNRGWESLAVDLKGRSLALWLDHRNVQTNQAAMHHHAEGAASPGATLAAEKPDPVARAAQSQLFFSSLDPSVPARAIAGGVCYCCKTALTTGQDGSIYAAWRHVYPGNQRDIAFTVSRDGGRSFVEPIRISEDRWQFDGCPENGPALAVDARTRVHAVWPTVINEEGKAALALFYAMSREGRTFGPRIRVPTSGAAYHPQIAIASDGSLVVAWDQVVDGTRRIAAARGRIDASGRTSFEVLRMTDAAGVYPAVVTTANHEVIAWTRRDPSGRSTIALARIAR
jgi:hypothetical protein